MILLQLKDYMEFLYFKKLICHCRTIFKCKKGG